MPKLPDGWRPMAGVSCAGWDICAAFNLSRPEGGRFAIFRRQITAQEHLDQARIYPTTTAVEDALREIKAKLFRGQYQLEELFPEEVLLAHPAYGSF